MGRCRNGNPKKGSRFICLRCLSVNHVGSGIQRGGKQREKGHIKNLECLCTGLNDRVPNLEVRYCDDMGEMMERAARLHEVYYNGKKVG